MIRSVMAIAKTASLKKAIRSTWKDSLEVDIIDSVDEDINYEVSRRWLTGFDIFYKPRIESILA